MAYDIDASGTWIVSLQRGRLLQQRLDALSAPARVLGAHQNAGLTLGPWRDRAVTGDSGGEVRIWNIPAARLERTLKSPADARSIALDPKARFLATGPGGGMSPRSRYLFDLAAPPTAEPVPLLGGEYGYLNALGFSPDGSWLASVNIGNVTLWNMRGSRSIVLGRQEPPFTILAFTRNGDLLSASDNGPLRRWPLSFAAGAGVQTLWSQPGAPIGFSVMEIDPAGRFAVLAVRRPGKVLVVPLDGSKPATYQVEARPGAIVQPVNYKLDPSGRFLAVRILSIGHPELNAIRTLDLATGDERTFDTHAKGGERCEEAGSANEGIAVPVWLRDGRLVSDGDAGLRVWDLATGASRLLRPCRKSPPDAFSLLASPDSRLVLRLDPADQTGLASSLSVFDLTSSATREITSHANRLWSFALDQSGMILVTGGLDGVVRVGPVTGEEPHLLFGHAGPVSSVAVSPDGRWIASGSDDGTIRLWPMPDLSKPPLHTLPHDALLAKLKPLTNLRAVRDPSSDTGWKIEFGPFPGWKDVPTW